MTKLKVQIKLKILFVTLIYLSIPLLCYPTDATVLKKDGNEFQLMDVSLEWRDGFFSGKGDDFLLKKRDRGWDKLPFNQIKEIDIDGEEVNILLRDGELIKGMLNEFQLGGEFFGFFQKEKISFKIAEIKKIVFNGYSKDEKLIPEETKKEEVEIKKEDSKPERQKNFKAELPQGNVDVQKEDNKPEKLRDYKRCTINKSHIYYKKSWKFCPLDGGKLE